MQAEQIHVTVVLKARPGQVLADLLPFLGIGSIVAVGRSGAVVSAVHDGDQVAHANLLENQLVLAEAAIKRGVRPGSGLRIDDWIATVANARRYEWLRDHSTKPGLAGTPMVRCGLGHPVHGADLDSLVNAHMVSHPGGNE